MLKNSMFVLMPYKNRGTWVFDDERVGLVREAFVNGMPEIIEHFVQDIPNAEDGFRLLFSVNPFPGSNITLEWQYRDFGGNWYRCKETGQVGWLCPALFKYFDEAPKTLYAKVEAIVE